MTESLLYHPLQVRGRYIKGNILAAPLAGYTDRAFRTLCTEKGANLSYTEMVSCEALIRDNDRTLELLQQAEAEENYAIQLFCGEPSTAAEAVRRIIPYNPLLIDLNCACPVPKIIKSGAGSQLLRVPQKLKDIVQAMTDSTDIPITIKIRLGWDYQDLRYKEVAEKAIEGGASMITLHGRTRSQGYGGKANWEYIKDLKKHLGDFPVIGSGDLFTPQDVKNLLESTGADGVMLARGVIGNPFLFGETRHFLQTGELLPSPSPQERMQVAFKQLKLSVHYKGEKTAIKEMRKHMTAYTKGLKGSSEIRKQITRAESFGEYQELIQGYLHFLEAKQGPS